MEDLFSSAAVAVVALFPVIDPIGNTPWFVAATRALAVAIGPANRHEAAVDYVGFALGIVAILLLTFLILTRASSISKRLGPRGIDVVNGIMGLIVLAIAAELVFHGIGDHFGLTVID